MVKYSRLKFEWMSLIHLVFFYTFRHFGLSPWAYHSLNQEQYLELKFPQSFYLRDSAGLVHHSPQTFFPHRHHLIAWAKSLTRVINGRPQPDQLIGSPEHLDHHLPHILLHHHHHYHSRYQRHCDHSQLLRGSSNFQLLSFVRQQLMMRLSSFSWIAFSSLQKSHYSLLPCKHWQNWPLGYLAGMYSIWPNLSSICDSLDFPWRGLDSTIQPVD